MAIHSQAMSSQTEGAPAKDATAATTNSSIAPMPIDSLHPALDQVVSALGQVEAGRWKVSREWKHQLREDADSIQQDISSQLPALFAKAKAAPLQIGPQLAVMQNVNALYDVLVRVSTAANLGGSKADAGLLDSAVQQLESSRKGVSEQLLRAATLQDQRVVLLQSQVQQTSGQTQLGPHANTIIVDNDGRHRSKHHKPTQHKKATTPTEQSVPKPPAPN